MKLPFMALALAAAVLGACAGPTTFETRSGRPEVTISRVAPDKVKSALVNKMIDGGYRITKDTQFELTFDKVADNAVTVILLSTNGGGPPDWRVAYSIAQVGDDVRVVADVAIIQNPGSPHEYRIDINSPGTREDAPSRGVQAMLDNLRTELSSTQTSDNKPPAKKPTSPPPTAAR